MAANSYTISGYEVSQSIENNTSYVYVYGTLVTDPNTYNGYNTAYYNFTATQGSQSFGTGNIYFSVGKNNTKTFSATLGPFQHNSDGSLGSVTVTSRCYVVPGYPSTDFNISITVPMGTIPRASSIGDVAGNIGATITIPVDRKSSDFTTTLTYTFGSLSGTIVSKTSSTNPSWTIPTNFYTQIPNSKSGTGTVTCTTYSGNTQIGSSVSRTLTAYAVEGNVNPTVSISNVVETDTKLIDKLGSGAAYVKGFSKPKVTFSASARSSASLSALSVNGVSVPTNTTQYTINNINTNTITVRATDSRGYSKTATYTLSPFDNYQSPNATFTTLKRNTPTNGQIDIVYSGSWYNGDFDVTGGTQANSLNVTLQYKESGTSTWINYGTLTPTISGNNFSQTLTIGDDGTVDGLFEYTKAWDIKLTLKDYLCDGDTGYDTIPVSGSITKGKPTFWWDDDLHVEGNLYYKGQQLLNLFYPVGSIYMSTTQNSSTASTAGKYGCPIAEFGGTWERIQNRFLLSAGNTYTAGNTGGAATVTLTEQQMPSHYHYLYDAAGGSITFPAYTGSTQGHTTGGSIVTGYASITTSVGNDEAHNNMPPYLVVYIWKRIQ